MEWRIGAIGLDPDTTVNYDLPRGLLADTIIRLCFQGVPRQYILNAIMCITTVGTFCLRTTRDTVNSPPRRGNPEALPVRTSISWQNPPVSPRHPRLAPILL
jgi:hypothetical protein